MHAGTNILAESVSANRPHTITIGIAQIFETKFSYCQRFYSSTLSGILLYSHLLKVIYCNIVWLRQIDAHKIPIVRAMSALQAANTNLESDQSLPKNDFLPWRLASF